MNDDEETGFKAENVLGIPDAMPYGLKSYRAAGFREGTEHVTLVVKFSQPQLINAMVVVENNDPGKIVDVSLFDLKGKKHLIYRNRSVTATEHARSLVLKMPTTLYEVNEVEIHMNVQGKGKDAQIDAIGIASAFDRVLVKELKELQVPPPVFEMAFSAEAENLGEGINTRAEEKKPIISPDGRTLYFVRQFDAQNTGGVDDAQDIYVAHKNEKGVWGEAQNIGRPLNDQHANGVCSVSPDGKRMILLNDSFAGKRKASGGMSTFENGQWSIPKRIEIKDFANYSEFEDFYLTNNGQVLLLAIDNSDGYGDQDLMFCRKYSGGWSAPINLGSQINTSGAEYSPFLASDNKTLYFASTGHGGMGGSDIFYSRRMDDTWKKWTKPKNIGSIINTKNNESYYAISAAGDEAFFVSEGRNGTSEIFRIALPKEAQPDPVLLLYGRVINMKTKEKMRSKIVFTDVESDEVAGEALSSASEKGYQIVLPKGKHYRVSAELDGYLPVDEWIDLKDFESYEEVRKDLHMIPLEIGQKMKLSKILFDRGTVDLSGDAAYYVERLADLMKMNPAMRIELGGHTDNRGSFQKNLLLSRERVELIKSFLIDLGVEASRVEAKGYGSTRPVASNDNPEKRKLNRRVEFKIIGL
ncbi:MAG: OmpA family protein [Cytophagales bacterium]|nr:OmpA family protein [Cytophagales bacterium]